MGAGGYFLWLIQVGRMAQGVVARADRAVEQGDYAKAVELYTQHLTVVPERRGGAAQAMPMRC